MISFKNIHVPVEFVAVGGVSVAYCSSNDPLSSSMETSSTVYSVSGSRHLKTNSVTFPETLTDRTSVLFVERVSRISLELVTTSGGSQDAMSVISSRDVRKTLLTESGSAKNYEKLIKKNHTRTCKGQLYNTSALNLI